MEKFILQVGEKLIINDPHAMWMKTETMAIDGCLKLTDKRIVFVKNATPFMQLFSESHKCQVLQDFPLDTLKSYSRKKYFKNERLIIDNGVDRPREYVTSKIESFIAELKNAGKEFKE